MILKSQLISLLALTCVTSLSSAQLLHSTQVNSSTIAYGATEMAILGNNVFVAFQRGSGSGSTLDRQIKVCVSTDQGRSFIEHDITILNTYIGFPRIVASSSAVLVFYEYDDAGSNRRLAIARSTNGGSSFTVSTTSDTSMIRSVNGIGLGQESLVVSDGGQRFFILGALEPEWYLMFSNDGGSTFVRRTIPLPFNSYHYYASRLTVLGGSLWFATMRTGSPDSLRVFRSTNDGLNWTKIASLVATDIPQTYYRGVDDYALDIIATSSGAITCYTEIELSVPRVKRVIISGTTVGAADDIGTGVVYRIHKTQASERIQISSPHYLDQAVANWTVPLDLASEFQFYPNGVIFPSDTSIGLLRRNTSPNEILFAMVRTTTAPIPDLPNDTLITGTYLELGWASYPMVYKYRVQLSTESNFSSMFLDSLIVPGYPFRLSTWQLSVPLTSLSTNGDGRFFYRIRAEENADVFDWSPVRSVRLASPTSVPKVETIPMNFAIQQNYPNPYNPSTTIQYDLAERSNVRIEVYNQMGQKVQTLVDQELHAGYHQVVWDANVATGLYYYRIEAVSVSDPSKRFVETKKMILLR